MFGPNPWFAGLIIAALLLGWAYSAPPLRFSAKGLGEVSTALAFVFLPGFGYTAAAGHLDAGFVPLALPLLLLGFSFILAVELPDLEADTAAGRRNFTVRYGIGGAARGMLVGTGAAMAVYAVLAATGIEPLPAVLAGLALSPLPFASAAHAVLRMGPEAGRGDACVRLAHGRPEPADDRPRRRARGDAVRREGTCFGRGPPERPLPLEQQTDDREHDEDDHEPFCHVHREPRYAPGAKDCRNDCKDEEHDCQPEQISRIGLRSPVFSLELIPLDDVPGFLPFSLLGQ